jgi:hypothetical protein
LTRHAVGGECNLIVLDAGDVQQFLKDALAHGPKQVSAVEEAAEKAHIDAHALAQARADLGLVTSRGNAGGAMAVQWSLPAS